MSRFVLLFSTEVLRQKIINQLRVIDIDMHDFKKRKYLVSAPMLGHMHLLIKVHKKNFPGRVLVSQVRILEKVKRIRWSSE